MEKNSGMKEESK